MHFVFAGICARPAEVESEHAYAARPQPQLRLLVILPRSGDEIDRWVGKTDTIEVILHFTEYHATIDTL
jgi:hypothetical protein